MYKMHFLDRIADSGPLGEPCREALHRAMRLRVVREDHEFSPQRGDARELIHLQSGIARVYATTHDGLDVTQYFVRGDDVLAVNLDDAIDEIEHVQAITDVHYLSIDFARFEGLVATYPELTLFYAALLRERKLRALERQQRRLRAEPMDTYASFLRSYPELETQVPTIHLASFLGLSPDEFMRARQQWRDRSLM